MSDKIIKILEVVSQLVPLILFVLTIIGFVIGRFVYKISLLQPLEKIANEQQEYRRKSSQEALKKAITGRHLLLGDNFLSVGNLSAAKLEFKAALLVDPINEEASMGLFKSQIYDNIENLGFTPEVLMKKVDLIFQYNPEDAHAFYFMGLLYRTIDYQLAIEYFKKAINSNPQFPDAYYRIGMLYEIVDELNTGLALKYYEKALELSKFNQTYLNNLGYQYFQLGLYDKAIENYETLIKLDKDDVLPYLTISTSYLLAGNLEKSCLFANQFVDKFQKKPNVMEVGFNKMEWYFESYNAEKILLETKEKKMMYGYLSAYYKNLILKPTDNFQILLDKAAELFKTNNYDNACVLKLVNFEISNYLEKLHVDLDRRELIQQKVDDTFKSIQAAMT